MTNFYYILHPLFSHADHRISQINQLISFYFSHTGNPRFSSYPHEIETKK